MLHFATPLFFSPFCSSRPNPGKADLYIKHLRKAVRAVHGEETNPHATKMEETMVVFEKSLSFCFSDFFCQYREYLEKVSDNSVVGYSKNRSIRIFVDCDNDIRTAHPGKMLDSS